MLWPSIRNEHRPLRADGIPEEGARFSEAGALSKAGMDSNGHRIACQAMSGGWRVFVRVVACAVKRAAVDWGIMTVWLPGRSGAWHSYCHEHTV